MLENIFHFIGNTLTFGGKSYSPKIQTGNIKLENGSRVGVLGGGPAGSFFSYFLLDMAKRNDLEILLDIYEPRDFSRPAPAGCNMCGGIISESLLQTLAAEGINLPSTVVQRGIDSYVMHLDAGTVRIDTPFHEKRIAAVHRGAGPKGIKEMKWGSFDGYLQKMTLEKGANLLPHRVHSVTRQDGKFQIKIQEQDPVIYDLIAVATGVNAVMPQIFNEPERRYAPPRTSKTYISEFCLGQETVQKHFGNSMHVFLLDLPRLEFAALIPKGEYVTMVMLGRDIDKNLVNSFLNSREVKACFPQDWGVPEKFCQCVPKINVDAASPLFYDRVVFIGDCGVSRLYKDGIGAAYRAAKSAATTCIFEGISTDNFRKSYRKTCNLIRADNNIGKLIFAFTRLLQKMKFARRGILCMVSKEQKSKGKKRLMSAVLWDVFTGSAPYRDILVRTLHPYFLAGLLKNTMGGFKFYSQDLPGEIPADDPDVKTGDLGKIYLDGEVIVRQGETGSAMYVIQKGKVRVFQYDLSGRSQKQKNNEVCLTTLGEGDFFGEMSLFENEIRSATVRAEGEVRLITLDKKTFFRRIYEDPALVFRIIEKMSFRIRELNSELVRLKPGQEDTYLPKINVEETEKPENYSGKPEKTYQDNEVIIRQGEEKNCMYVIQSGKVNVFKRKEDKEVLLATLEEGDFFGEMALFGREVRSATVRAAGKVRLIAVEKKSLLRRINEDPSIAFHIVRKMSNRIRRLSGELTRIK